MNKHEILRSCTNILREIVADDSVILEMDTRRQDIPAWDSLAYITFIASAEAEFDVKFRVADVESFATVGQIVERIATLKGWQ